MHIRSVNPDEPAPVSTFLQSGFWGKFKEEFGWKSFSFHISYDSGKKEKHLLVLVRRLQKFFSLAYIPNGPIVSPPCKDEEYKRYFTMLPLIAKSIRSELPTECVFVRFDPPWNIITTDNKKGKGELHNPKEIDELYGRMQNKLIKAPVDIQPRSTVILDINTSEKEILGQMKAKTRYNIKLASKKGVEIAVTSMDNMDEAMFDRWYSLYRETAIRDKITLHERAYYHRFFGLSSEIHKTSPGMAPKLFMLESYHEGDYLAGIVLTVYGEEAVYLYGASSGQKRNLMPTYGLQWRAIQLARDEGCKTYDLFGIPPQNDPSHPMHGLFRFKVGFGGKIVHRLGCWDYPYSELKYTCYKSAEKVRRFYYHRFRKRSRFRFLKVQNGLK